MNKSSLSSLPSDWVALCSFFFVIFFGEDKKKVSAPKRMEANKVPMVRVLDILLL